MHELHDCTMHDARLRVISNRGTHTTWRPQAEPVYEVPRLDIIRIRQPSAPNNEFIIPLSHFIIPQGPYLEKIKGCRRPDIFRIRP